jgi:transposase-like protein
MGAFFIGVKGVDSMEKTSGLSISVDMNSSNLVRKLKVISKHTEALANELEEIDKTTCPNCGSSLNTDALYANGELYRKNVYCTDCRYVESDSND